MMALALFDVIGNGKNRFLKSCENSQSLNTASSLLWARKFGFWLEKKNFENWYEFHPLFRFAEKCKPGFTKQLYNLTYKEASSIIIIVIYIDCQLPAERIEFFFSNK